jgi:DNA invertase Pin-like site-specific DNA recombinase
MPEDIQVDQDKFDAVLKRMLNMKPISKEEISARIKAERAAKKAAKDKRKVSG